MKIKMPLECNEDGYPPIQFELLNATAITAETFRIENAPFFAPNISYHDIIHARESNIPAQFDYVDLIEASTFNSISILILDEEMNTFLMDLLRGLNCVIEYGEFGKFHVLAVAVPATTDYPKLRAQLEILELESKLSFAELAVV